MVKHTQTIRVSVIDHLVGLALKGLNINPFLANVSILYPLKKRNISEKFREDIYREDLLKKLLGQKCFWNFSRNIWSSYYVEYLWTTAFTERFLQKFQINHMFASNQGVPRMTIMILELIFQFKNLISLKRSLLNGTWGQSNNFRWKLIVPIMKQNSIMDILRRKAPSKKRNSALTKSLNLDISVNGTSNQFSIEAANRSVL